MPGELARFFGFGATLGGGQSSELGVGHQWHDLGSIPGDWGKELASLRHLPRHATAAQAEQESETAGRMKAQVSILKAMQRAKFSQAQSVAAAIQLQIDHDVQMSGLNSQVATSQARAVSRIAGDNFRNRIAGAGAQGQVNAYNDQTNVFSL